MRTPRQMSTTAGPRPPRDASETTVLDLGAEAGTLSGGGAETAPGATTRFCCPHPGQLTSLPRCLSSTLSLLPHLQATSIRMGDPRKLRRLSAIGRKPNE